MTARVLVLDDDPVQRRLVEAMLRRLGHEPIAVDSGEAAARRLFAGDGIPLLALLDAEGRMRPLDELEAEIIRFAIAHHEGRMSEVARRLGIGRSTLYRKLGELGLGETTQDELPPDRDRSVAPE